MEQENRNDSMLKEQLKISPRRLSITVVIIFLIFLVSGIYLKAYCSGGGFVSLIQFGAKKFKQAIPEVRSLPIFVNHNLIGKSGYDGQFYAQLSIDPTLRNPGFDKALDNTKFRSRRIFLPFLSHVLGLGNPSLIIQVYAVINFFFWLLLVFLLLKAFPAYSLRAILCLIAIMLNKGVVTSLSKALTDLPAATLTLAAVLLQSYGGAMILSLATLTRECSIFGLAGLIRLKDKAIFNRKNLILFCIVIVPFLLWCLYTFLRFSKGSVSYGLLGRGNFFIPFLQIFNFVKDSFSHLAMKWPHLCASFNVWKVLADVDMGNIFSILLRLIAIAYLFVCRKPDSNIWRLGVTYAVVALFTSWQEGDRLFLPLIFSFYILLASEKNKLFFPLFILASLNVPYTIYSLIKTYLPSVH